MWEQRLLCKVLVYERENKEVKIVFWEIFFRKWRWFDIKKVMGERN